MLDGNNLVSLPDTIGRLVVGSQLSLTYNSLQTLPESFGNITHSSGGRVMLLNNPLLEHPAPLYPKVTVRWAPRANSEGSETMVSQGVHHPDAQGWNVMNTEVNPGRGY